MTNNYYISITPSEQSFRLFRHTIHRNSNIGDIIGFSFELLFLIITLTVLGLSLYCLVKGLYNHLFGMNFSKPKSGLDYEHPYDI